MSTIQSPLPGVFFRRPAPESDEFVKPGDEVSEGTTIGLVEVMKSFNELKATGPGTLKEFLVEDGDEITPGQDIAVVV